MPGPISGPDAATHGQPAATETTPSGLVSPGHAPAPEDEYPCYTELQMWRRRARHPTSPLSETLTGLPGEVLSYLADSALVDVLDALNLGPLERAIAEMRLAGASIREIAAGTGLKKWRVERAMLTIRRHLSARLAVPDPHPVRHAGHPGSGCGGCRTAGWQEVYLSETHRKGKKEAE